MEDLPSRCLARMRKEEAEQWIAEYKKAVQENQKEGNS